MKVTIYVQEDHLENLNKFLFDGEVREVVWFHDRPGNGKFYAVTISYGDFVRLNDLSENLHN